MKFNEKLRRLAEGKNKSQLAAKVGLGPSIISNYMAKGSIPRGDIALKIAQAFDVPFDWLLDDTREEWPPPPVQAPALSSLPERDLILEMVRRYRLFAVEIRRELDEVKAHDWRADALALAKDPFNVKDDDRLQTADEHVRTMLRRLRERFDLRLWSVGYHDMLPGREYKDYTSVDPDHLGTELAECQKNPWLQLTRSLVRWRAEQPIPDHIKPLIEKTVAEIKALDAQERDEARSGKSSEKKIKHRTP